MNEIALRELEKNPRCWDLNEGLGAAMNEIALRKEMKQNY